MEFVDRYLKCSDCSNEFVFTAGEQLFFNDKQFKNDPKRCKLCKAKRAGLGRSPNASPLTALPFSKTETRTECSVCGIETTVPFKPTQGRPVLCRSCFVDKRVPSISATMSPETPMPGESILGLELQASPQIGHAGTPEMLELPPLAALHRIN